jgi:4-hydroxybenzoate polyprenyltransferase
MKRHMLSYLQLCRAANVFTALADIFLGYLLTHNSLQPGSRFGLLLAASAGLYLAGMVFNDIFDRQVDARERPARPLPSGRVSLRGAVIFGSLLLGVGVVSAGLAGQMSLIVAGLLVACIFAYDGLLKGTPLGPVMMGACRFLNVMLGASAAGLDETSSTVLQVWGLPQVHVALALGVYIAGVTWFARHEAGTSPRWQLVGATGVINGGLMLLLAFVFHWPDGTSRGLGVLLFLGFLVVSLDRRLIAAWLTPTPEKVQGVIKTLLLSLVMLDAAIVLFVQPDVRYAIMVIALLAPALLLSRFLAVT